jgi:anti-sigma regulatory factor (Ser/Thr protein kinase)
MRHLILTSPHEHAQVNEPPTPPTAFVTARALMPARSPDAAAPSRELACFSPETGNGQVLWRLPRQASSVRPARRLAGDQLDHWGFGYHREVAELLVSELVTNAIRHGTGAINLTITMRDGTLRFEVQDEAADLVPHIRPVGAADEGGRGLHLVGMLSSRWGATRTAAGKVVWFELQAHGPPEPNDVDK